ncbi:hypothetical protein FCV25MIE_17056 [Fagus crenata]
MVLDFNFRSGVGDLERFLRFVGDVHSTCLGEIDDFTDEGEKRTHGYKVMKEFAHSLFNELFHLECLGLYFTDCHDVKAEAYGIEAHAFDCDPV